MKTCVEDSMADAQHQDYHIPLHTFMYFIVRCMLEYNALSVCCSHAPYGLGHTLAV